MESEPARVLPRPGERLGDFELEEVIGRGGMGIVFRASQRSLGGRQVALKVLTDEGTNVRAELRFRREARLASELHHQNLSEVYGFGSHDGYLFYAMRLVEGPTLQLVLERLAADPTLRDSSATRRALVAQAAAIADALATVHSAGLVHRDVKPSNVILAGGDLAASAIPREAPVLVDFGLVRHHLADTVTAAGRALGSFPYMAPEQLLGSTVDARTDTFGLGVTLHDLLSGRLPDERVQASAGLEPLDELLPAVDPDLVAIVAKAVDPMPRWRYATAEALRNDLDAWLRGEPVVARRQPWAERGLRWTTTHARGLARTGAAGLLIGLVAWGLVWTRQVRGAADRAGRAGDAGDPVALASAVNELPTAVLPSTLVGDDVASIARRLRAPEPEDPLVRILERLRAADERGALFEAAAYLGASGLSSDGVVTRYFEAALESPSAQRVEAAREFAARLFHVRPDRSIDDRIESERLRNTIRRQWADPAASKRGRLWLLTALSGCGTWQDVEPIFAWALEQGPHSEERRLALRSVERIVRRAHAMGELARIDAPHILVTIAPFARDVFADESGIATDPSWSGIQQAYESLASALAIASRATGRDVDLRPMLPESWTIAVREGRPALLIALWLSAASASTESFERVRSGAALEPGCEGAGMLGYVCGVHDDDALTAEAAALVRAAPSHSFARFQDGVAEGQRALGGRMATDPGPSHSVLGVPTIEGAQPAKIERVPGALFTPSIARWVFSHDRVKVFGCATGADLRQTRLVRNRPDHASLGRFGRSSVRLHLDVSDLPHPRARTLVIHHLAAARPYLPRQGEVHLQIRIDGEDLKSAAVSKESWAELTVELPSRRLDAGPHVIELRASDRTTTNYWLDTVELRDD